MFKLKLTKFYKKFLNQKHKSKAYNALDCVAYQLARSSMVHGYKQKILKNVRLGLLYFKLNLRQNQFKYNASIRIFLTKFLLNSRYKFELRFKRVGGVYYNIPHFLDPSREILATIKHFAMHVHGSLLAEGSLAERINFELIQYRHKKGLFLQDLQQSNKTASLNKSYVKYLRFVRNKKQLRLDTSVFFLRFIQKFPFLKILKSRRFIVKRLFDFKVFKIHTQKFDGFYYNNVVINNKLILECLPSGLINKMVGNLENNFNDIDICNTNSNNSMVLSQTGLVKFRVLYNDVL